MEDDDARRVVVQQRVASRIAAAVEHCRDVARGIVAEFGIRVRLEVGVDQRTWVF